MDLVCSQIRLNMVSIKKRPRKTIHTLGGSPGLVVKGGDLSTEGRGFEPIYWMDIFSDVCLEKIVIMLV